MNNSNTPLHDAAKRGDMKTLVSLLEKKGYDINARGVCTEDIVMSISIFHFHLMVKPSFSCDVVALAVLSQQNVVRIVSFTMFQVTSLLAILLSSPSHSLIFHFLSGFD